MSSRSRSARCAAASGRCRGARAGTPVCHTCRRKRRPEVGAAGPGVLGVRADPAVLLRAHRAPDVPLLRRAPRVAPRAVRVLRQGRDRRRAHPRRRGMRHLPGTADVAPSSPASAASRPHDHPPGSAGVCERCAGERVAQICTQCGAEELNYTGGPVRRLLAQSARPRARPGRRPARCHRTQPLSGRAGRRAPSRSRR